MVNKQIDPGSPTVAARRAVTTPIRRLWFTDHVVASLWFAPAVVGVAAYVLSRVTLWADRRIYLGGPSAWLFTGDGNAAAQVTSTLTAAMLAFLAVVFSTTLVAVQLASSQYSPSIVRVFVRSRMTRATMATFVAAFVFSLNAMAGSRQVTGVERPVLTVTMLYVLALATVAMFVAFFHCIVRLLRVQYLFLSISREAHQVIERDFPREAAYTETPRPEPDPGAATVTHRGRPGVLEALDVGGLAAAAGADGAWFEMLVSVGDPVGYRTPLARVHHGGQDVIGRFEHLALIGGERTQLQDPAFGIRQLVDAACRALSPAVNDPTTAVQAAHRISDLLARVAERPDPTGWYTDDSGAARVHLIDDSFALLAELGFTEITLYGGNSPQVTRCLRAIFEHLGQLVDAERAAVIDQLTGRLDASIAASMPGAFLEIASQADPLGLG